MFTADTCLLPDALRAIARAVDEGLDQVLQPPGDGRDQLYAAMRHAAIGGGKRLRPLLVKATADLFAVPEIFSLRAGLAIECLHVHSLIHDDLPCMDDDDMRRGKPTVHRAFDEATAVLAGDALHAFAFEILADPATHPNSDVRSALVMELARYAGAAGMAGGQMLDLLPTEQMTSLEAITRLQEWKTGALIEWSVDAGALLGGASSADRTALRAYAQRIGLAFQIADDLLDVEGSEDVVGKRLNKDQAQGKSNFVTVLGVDDAKEMAMRLVDEAMDQLQDISVPAHLLTEIAAFAIARDR
ncbi:polyprenyl synthetase family protein [Sphingomonas montanisoli]|uniref:Polyprenyl synthetase family protein n=1 Tax=Sphingomonas montanisoli TaxID=2606412 RepID=A0A5D9C8S3_9SPHN|nr:farnesyl diphosphate synthase [Sphingomonas montanisoli]TZG28089.1 polyprenyl synthetase family protein [Sphingomonas montanisoli]